MLHSAFGLVKLYIIACKEFLYSEKIKRIDDIVAGNIAAARHLNAIACEELFEPEKVKSIKRKAVGRYEYKVYRLFKDFDSYDECLRENKFL